jgi:hypothetical protein
MAKRSAKCWVGLGRGCRGGRIADDLQVTARLDAQKVRIAAISRVEGGRRGQDLKPGRERHAVALAVYGPVPPTGSAAFLVAVAFNAMAKFKS